ncbi:septum formation initiator family protein [Pseudoroseicyclus sp. CXY001]|uniref:FtsB family cell division protein n=1 Tax=Pseudoroseicyclus sp. CXY001 TaxID=3242492 RepID=UPI00358DD872
MSRPPLAPVVYSSAMVLLAVYFMFAAVQGDYGLFRRAEVEAEERALQEQLATLEAEVAKMENLTHRLSDDYLDLDLLDERARDVLGYIRSDELIIR